MAVGHYDYHEVQKSNDKIMNEHTMQSFQDDPLIKLVNRLKRREKQLKRVIKSARKWHRVVMVWDKAIRKIEDANQWHPWPEEKPEKHGPYLCYNSAGVYSEFYVCEYTGFWVSPCIDSPTVTHWRELPPGPEDV